MINFAMVKKVADELDKKQQKPTVKKVREILGSGGTNSIAKYLRIWKHEKFILSDDSSVTSKIGRNSLEVKIAKLEIRLEQAEKTNLALEQKVVSLREENSELQNQNLNLEQKLKVGEIELHKKSLEVESLNNLLTEIKIEHKSKLIFYESNTEALTKMNKQNYVDWNARYNRLEQKYEAAKVEHSTQVERLLDKYAKGNADKAFVLDNLARHVGELKRELSEKDSEVLRLNEKLKGISLYEQ